MPFFAPCPNAGKGHFGILCVGCGVFFFACRPAQMVGETPLQASIFIGEDSFPLRYLKCLVMIWVLPKDRGTPKSSFLIRFSLINHPFWGYHYFWKHPYAKSTEVSLPENCRAAFQRYTGIKNIASQHSSRILTSMKYHPRRKNNASKTHI